jgi:hypothetical protein
MLPTIKNSSQAQFSRHFQTTFFQSPTLKRFCVPLDNFNMRHSFDISYVPSCASVFTILFFLQMRPDNESSPHRTEGHDLHSLNTPFGLFSKNIADRGKTVNFQKGIHSRSNNTPKQYVLITIFQVRFIFSIDKKQLSMCAIKSFKIYHTKK